jgi:hypothetical protein
MSVSCTVFVLSGRGLCNGLITRPEESYRLWCVSECDQVKINNLDTCCEQVEEGRTATKSISFTLENLINVSLLKMSSSVESSELSPCFRDDLKRAWLLYRLCV